jgi:hypothetical protein
LNLRTSEEQHQEEEEKKEDRGEVKLQRELTQTLVTKSKAAMTPMAEMKFRSINF